MNVAYFYFPVAVLFLIVGLQQLAKAKKLPQQSEEELKSYNKTRSKGIGYTLLALSFTVLGVTYLKALDIYL